MFDEKILYSGTSLQVFNFVICDALAKIKASTHFIDLYTFYVATSILLWIY